MWSIIVLLSVAWCVQGSSELEPGTRIVNGQDTTIEDYPHMVSLRRPYGNSEYHFCGGSIIRPRWILSAAHCFDIEKINITVAAGATRQTAPGERYKVEKLIIHQNFSEKTFENDIALIEVTEDIKFSKKVKAINLPTTDTPGGVRLVATGWGQIDNYRHTYDKLQKLTVQSISLDECRTKYKPLRDKGLLKFSLTPQNICTFTRYGQGLCKGDSGGSIIKDNTVVGVTSYGIPCAKGYPDVFIRVYSYLDWIKENINE